MSDIPHLDVPALRSARWFVLDVMRKGQGQRRNAWTALLIDVDPDIWCLGQYPSLQPHSGWLDLGEHGTRGDAWDLAEQLTATRH